jgi:hypothetical protein
LIIIQTMVYQRLWYSHKFTQVFMIVKQLHVHIIHSCCHYWIGGTGTYFGHSGVCDVWESSCFYSVVVLFRFVLIWSPINLKIYYDFGDCSFILMNVWKVGCICSTVTQARFTVTECIDYKHHKNILILMEIPFLNRLDIYWKLHLLLI